MNYSVILVILSLLVIVVTVLAGMSWKKNKQNDTNPFLSLATIIISAAVGVGTLIIGINPEYVIKVVIPDIEKIVNENSELKVEVEKLKEEKKDSEELVDEIQEKLDNSKFAEIKSGKLIIDGLDNGEKNNVVAVIDGKNYYLESFIDSLVENKIEFNGENIIFGKDITSAQVQAISFEDFNPGYKVLYDGEYFTEFRNGEESFGEGYAFDKFSMAGKEYRNGFSLRYKGNVLLKLDRQFSGMKIDVGRIDGTNNDNTSAVIEADGVEMKTLDLKYDNGVQTYPENGVIDLNFADIVKISLRGEDGRTVYGFTNIVLYY